MLRTAQACFCFSFQSVSALSIFIHSCPFTTPPISHMPAYSTETINSSDTRACSHLFEAYFLHDTCYIVACGLKVWLRTLGDPWSPSCRIPLTPHLPQWTMPARGSVKRPRKTSNRCVPGPLSGSAPGIIMTSSRPRAIPKGAQVCINGHLASRCANLPWTEVRDRVLDLLPVALQNTLRSEIDLMGENWGTPLLPNDAFIIRKSTTEDLPEPEEAANHAMDLLRGFLSQRTDDYERIMDVGFKLPSTPESAFGWSSSCDPCRWISATCTSLGLAKRKWRRRESGNEFIALGANLGAIRQPLNQVATSAAGWV